LRKNTNDLYICIRLYSEVFSSHLRKWYGPVFFHLNGSS